MFASELKQIVKNISPILVVYSCHQTLNVCNFLINTLFRKGFKLNEYLFSHDMILDIWIYRYNYTFYFNSIFENKLEAWICDCSYKVIKMEHNSLWTRTHYAYHLCLLHVFRK